MVYDTINGETFIPIFSKKEEEIVVWTSEKESKKTKNSSSKISRKDESGPSVQSELGEPEQCKQRKCIYQNIEID